MSAKRKKLLIVGGGIAGLSLASQSTRDFDVTVVEAEFSTGYHSTGRSAAVFHIAFENDVIHRLSLASESFFREPPSPFGSVSSSLHNMMIARPDESDLVEGFLETWSGRCPWLKRLRRSQMLDYVPVLADVFTQGVLDVRSRSLDVHSLMDGYRRKLTEAGGQILSQRRLVELHDESGLWTANFESGQSIQSDILVNAAGAWADDVASMAGVNPIGLAPKRRTGLRVHPEFEVEDWPMCYLATGELYFKPEGNALMLSPVDATESEPCDAQPEDLDVAIGMDRLQRCLKLNIDRPTETWAGLRSFVPDGTPVIGYAPDHPGLFWYAAFGGFGVQTSPACSLIGETLLRGNAAPLPFDVTESEVGPSRLETPLAS